MKRIFYLLIIILACSCQRRELTYDYYPYSDMRINVDWSETLYGEETPKSLTAWIYPKDGGEVIKVETNNVNSFIVPLPRGTYDIVVFNRTYDVFKTIGFRGMASFNTLEVYTKAVVAKSWYIKGDSERLSSEVDKIALGVYRDLEITDEMLEVRSEKNITVKPEFICKELKVSIGVDNSQYLRSVRGAISNMAQEYVVNRESVGYSSVTNLLEQWCLDGDWGRCVLLLNTRVLGLVSDMSKESKYDYWNGELYLEVLLVDNTVRNFTRILDGSMVKELSVMNKENVLMIDLEGDVDMDLVLPIVVPDDGVGGGFDASINDWENEVEIPVYIN